jgi:hypothetical protein
MIIWLAFAGVACVVGMFFSTGNGQIVEGGRWIEEKPKMSEKVSLVETRGGKGGRPGERSTRALADVARYGQHSQGCVHAVL